MNQDEVFFIHPDDLPPVQYIPPPDPNIVARNTQLLRRQLRQFRGRGRGRGRGGHNVSIGSVYACYGGDSVNLSTLK